MRSPLPWLTSGLTVLAFLLFATTLARADQPGEPLFGRERYVEYRPGNLPLILVAGHGGDLSPDEVRDRAYGPRGTDRNTREVAVAAAEQIALLTGGRPHLILCHLHRLKLDVNRPIEEAAQGDPLAEQAWHEFHRFIASARASVIADHGRGLLVDIHGHGHAIPRIELGYALGREELNQDDHALDHPELVALSTLRPLAIARPELSFSLLVRGPDSLGALLTNAGFPAWPSPDFPRIGDAEFFRGGHIVRVHSRLDDPHPVTAIQAELPFVNIRDTEENRARFATALAASVVRYLNSPATFAFALPVRITPEHPAPAEGDLDDVGCDDGCATRAPATAETQP